MNALLVLSAGALAAVVSFLFALKGLPEVPDNPGSGNHYKED